MKKNGECGMKKLNQKKKSFQVASMTVLMFSGNFFLLDLGAQIEHFLKHENILSVR